tara:strand:- start:53 stop:433 length:381 start_codon:yes stop_codon:yes gene_type:complete
MLSIIEPSLIRTFMHSPIFNDILKHNNTTYTNYQHLNFSHDTTDNLINYSIDIPGVSQQDIDITCENNTIYISGVRNDKKFKYHFILPQKYNSDSAGATLQSGVLTISFDLKKELKPKKITVKLLK